MESITIFDSTWSPRFILLEGGGGGGIVGSGSVETPLITNNFELPDSKLLQFSNCYLIIADAFLREKTTNNCVILLTTITSEIYPKIAIDHQLGQRSLSDQTIYSTSTKLSTAATAHIFHSLVDVNVLIKSPAKLNNIDRPKRLPTKV
uniref:Uncharacterized protein n=1 Tax=Glossina pallidipes TaxID=7398 RepID=A0A1A9ZXJ4_GLOPL